MTFVGALTSGIPGLNCINSYVSNRLSISISPELPSAFSWLGARKDEFPASIRKNTGKIPENWAENRAEKRRVAQK